MKNLLKMRGAKRNMLALLMLLPVGVAANAAPAKPGQKRQLRLDNGTTVTATLVGDEYGHYWLGDDGQAYSDNGNTYRRVDAQMVKQNAQLRRENANRHRMQRMKHRAPAAHEDGQTGTYIGEKKGLIILVNFGKNSTHFKTSNDKTLFERIANEEGFNEGDFKGSLYDYFHAQSRGQFLLTFDVVGPVEVSQKFSYYGTNYGGDDAHPAEMVIEALALVDEEVDFSKYDWDGDGMVDQVYIIYAGKGEADGGATNTIWPHEWTLSEATKYGDGGGPQELDGVTIDTYACGPELNGNSKVCGIGTMCHEFSHCFGYPDFYDTGYNGGQGMFLWDLMDTGCYNGDGYLPVGYTSYERWIAGWLEPIELTTTSSISNMKSLQDGGEAYILYNNGNRDEFFMLENRQKTGWDGDIPGEGLLILHVDYDQSIWEDNSPNDDPDHQRMTWIPADGEYQSETTYYYGSPSKKYTEAGAMTDPFPYGYFDAFGASTLPAAKFYNKNNDDTYFLDSSVEQITQNVDGTVSFVFRAKSNVETPTFKQRDGMVSINCATEGATIYYTVDGTTPTTESIVFSQPFAVDDLSIIKAMAVKDEEQSALALAKLPLNEFDIEILCESLSGYTAENDGPSALSTDDERLDYQGWASMTKVFPGGTSNAYANGGCLKLGSSGATGSMTTTSLPLSGSAILTFYLKKYGSDTGRLKVTVKGAKADVTTFTPTSDWTPYTVKLTNATGDVTITFATSSKRAYLDEIKVAASEIVTPVTPEIIVPNTLLEFETTVGTPKTLQLTVKSTGLTDDISLKIGTGNAYFDLGTTTIDKEEEEAVVDVVFNPQAAGSYSDVIILSSEGAEDVEVVLNGTANEALPPTGDDLYELVTDASTLTDGDEVLIAYVKEDGSAMAMSTTQNANNRAATTNVVLNTDGTLAPGEEVQLVTLEMDGDNYLFNVGDGYLYAASSDKNWLRTEEEADDNAQATISIDADGNATIQFQGSNTRNHLRFNENNGNPIFSCYEESSTVITLPQIYRKTKPEVINVTIGESGYTTLFYGEKNLVVPEGVEAYTFSLADSGGLQPSVLAEGYIINMGTAVVVKSLDSEGEPQDFGFMVTSDSGDEVVDNLLMGSDTETLTYGPDSEEDYTFYMLKLGEDNDLASVGFYYGAEDGAAFTSEANKAWLAVPRLQANSITAFLLNGDIMSSVEHHDVERLNVNAQRTTVYDLLGRKMPNGQLSRGLYIVNGRKVFVK